MDAGTITEITVWTAKTLLPFLTAAVKAGESLFQKGIEKSAEKAGEKSVESLWGLVRRKAESSPAATEIVMEVTESPDDPDVQGAFRNQLRKLMRDDDTFARELSEFMQAAQENPTVYQQNIQNNAPIEQQINAQSVNAPITFTKSGG